MKCHILNWNFRNYVLLSLYRHHWMLTCTGIVSCPLSLLNTLIRLTTCILYTPSFLICVLVLYRAWPWCSFLTFIPTVLLGLCCQEWLCSHPALLIYHSALVCAHFWWMHLTTTVLWESRSGGPIWSVAASVFSVQPYVFYLLGFLSWTDKLPENKFLLFLFNFFSRQNI